MEELLRDAWLARDPLPEEPMPWLAAWLKEAFEAGAQPNPHAMALATVDPDGRPACRMLLCDDIDCEVGSLAFYSNRESRKGRALAALPRAAATFYFGPQGRQARLEGPVVLSPESESDAYFAGRPLDARIGAWASAQSRPIASRPALRRQMEETARRLGVLLEGPAPNVEVPRPPHWGGYRLVAERVELWVSRPGRLHDRALWTRRLGPAGEATRAEAWRVVRLQP